MKLTAIRMCSVIMALVFVLSSFAVAGYADNKDSEQEYRFTYIYSCEGNIQVGVLSTSVYTKIKGKSGVTSVKIKMELQKLSDGAYSTVETWEQTFSGTNGEMEESKLTNPLSTYRLKSTVTAYTTNDSESYTFYKYA